MFLEIFTLFQVAQFENIKCHKWVRPTQILNYGGQSAQVKWFNLTIVFTLDPVEQRISKQEDSRASSPKISIIGLRWYVGICIFNEYIK